MIVIDSRLDFSVESYSKSIPSARKAHLTPNALSKQHFL